VKDTTAGFVCYKADTLRLLPLDDIRFVGYAFQIEMKYRVKLAGLRITEVPITFIDRVKGQSKMSINIFREAIVGVLRMRFTVRQRKAAVVGA
jgi:dolichol-phosphate mannosyltransferase